MKRLLSVLITLFCLTLAPKVYASHFSGGEITYTCAGVDSFEVTLRAYRDCSGIPAGNSVSLTFTSTCGGSFNTVLPLVNTGGTEVSQLCPLFVPQSTCNGGTFAGMEEYVYQATVVLAPRCDAWTARWSQCCRNSSLNVAGGPAMSIATQIRNQTDTCNNSPIFTSQPIPYTCINQPVNYNYGAVDSDGDSLVYSLVSAEISAFATVTYIAPNTATVPIPGITLNQNGQLSFTPTAVGNFIVAVQVDEFDPGTGALLGNVRRDIQFVVENCGNNVPSAPTSFSNTSGSATFTAPTTVTAQIGQNFCFDAVFTDPNLADVLSLTSNATTVLPGATFTQTGTNPATGTICWTAVAGVSQNLSVSIFADDGACPIFGTNSQSFQIIVPPVPPLSVGLSITDVTCFGNCNGSATATISTDTTGNTYTYSWSNGTTTFGGGSSSLTNLCPGAITVFVTENPSGETFLVNPALNISEPGPLFFTLDTLSGVSCNGDCTGSINVQAVGGSSPLTYAWDDPASQIGTSASNLCAGTYNVLVTDANGCTITRQYTIVEPPAVVAIIDSSNNVTCNGGTDGEAFAGAFGGSSPSTSTTTYRVDQTGTFSPYTGSGTSFTLGSGSLDDGLSTGMSLGFGFEFFGTNFTQVFLSTNGFLTFTAGSPTGCCAGQALPSTAPPNNLIAFGWEDLNFGAGGTAEFWTAGAAPNRAFVLSITDLPHFGGGNLITTQIVLHETSNIIEIHTTSAPSDGGNHTMGIEGPAGTVGFPVPGRNSVNWATITNDYVAFIPEQNLSFSWPSGGTTGTETGLGAGTYCVTVTDVNGCTDTACVIITEPDPLAVSFATTDASCNGVCDGSATATVSGGTTPYTFAWPSGGTNATENGLCAGTFMLTVTDANGCTTASPTTIAEPAAIGITFSSTNASCNGTCDGTATAAASGGTPAFTFLWSSGGTAAAETGLCAGTHTVTVTDGNGCTQSATVSITEPTSISASITNTTNVSCLGGNDGTATAAGNGGTSPFTFAWPSGGTNATETGLSAGTFCVTVTDNNGCSDTACAIVSQPLNGVAASIISSSNVTCTGGNDGSATAASTGGTAPYTFAWPSGGSNATETGLSAGTFCVTVSDNNGCTDTACVIIGQPANPVTATIITSTNASCNGATDGTASAGASGGTTPYTFAWPSGGSTAIESGLGAGTYCVTITDANGCTDTACAVITEPIAVTASIAASTNISCNGAGDGTATAAGSGGTSPYSFVWSSGGTAALETGLTVGTHTVTVTDANGCTDTETVSITEPAVMTAAITSSTNVTCFGNGDGQATAGGSGGTTPYSFLWSTGATSVSVAGLVAGNYTVTVTDANGCSDIASVSITQPSSAVLAAITASTNVSCFGGNDGQATAAGSGGTSPYTFAWPSGGSNATETGLSAGTFCVTVSDANGCTDTACVILTQPASAVNAAIITTTPASCNGATDGSASAGASGGTSPYTFAWPSGGTAALETNLGAGTYCVTVTDANGCTDTACAVVGEPAAVIASIATSNNVSCFGLSDGDATAAATGGSAPYSFAWSTAATTASINSLAAGTYSVTVTDANGCTDSTSVVITQPAPLTVFVATLPASCAGICDGTASATVSGGSLPYTLSWPAGSPNNVCAGSFILTVTDGNGCTMTSPYTISAPAVIVTSITGVSNALCNGVCDGAATVSVTSGGTAPFTFNWSNGSVGTSPTNLCAGVNRVTVTDGNGCPAVDSVTITEPTPVVISITTTDASCNGICDGTATAAVSGGTSPYALFWPGGSNVNICAGNYVLTVVDANGCSDTASYIITEPDPIVMGTTVIANANCNGVCDGSATVGVVSGGTGPFTFAWSNGTTGTADNALCAGTHTITVTDGNGCTETTTINITEPAALVATVVVDNNVSCGGLADGAVTASAVGGTPVYTFAWSNGSSNASLTGLVAGTYTVTITDANGCTSVDSATITEPATIVTSIINVTNVLCNGECDGVATATVASGGTAPFTFVWSTGGVNAMDTSLCAGINRVTVTDANGCTAVDSISITQPLPLNISVTTTNATCSGICDGMATANVTGGTSPYALFWPGGSNVNLCAGNYVLTVVDFNGCSDTASYIITQPTTIVPGFTGVSNVSCNGICDGTATAGVTSGGTAPFTFNWSNGATNTSLTGLCAGTFTVTISDANGCSVADSVIITEPAAIVVTVAVDSNVFCPGQATGGVTASVTGGTNPYTFNWSNAATTPSITGLTAGTYTVTVTDANGCTEVDSATVTEPAPIVSNITNITNASCNGVCDGSASVAVTSGGTAPFSFVWSTGFNGANPNNLCAGTNTVTITDANGCTSVDNATITEPAAIAITVTTTNASCNGVCDGTATGAASGGTAPYTFQWPGGSNTNLCAGSYMVTVVDANGCSDSTGYTITEPAIIDMAFTNVVNASCSGTCDGSATVGVTSGGTAPFSFVWSSGSTSTFDTALCAGTTTVTVTDANGCTAVDSINITQPGSLTVNVITQDATCNGNCDGAGILIAAGGTPNYTYAWPSGAAVPVDTALCAGTYLATVTDAAGCSVVVSVTIGQPASITTSISGVTNATCNGTCDGAATVSAANGNTPYTFIWTSGETSASATALCAGMNYVTVTDSNQCTAIDSILITQPTGAVITMATTNTSCNGICDGTATPTVIGGSTPYTFLWSNSSTTANQVGLCAGTYTLTLTDANGCSQTAQAIITEPAPIILNFSGVTTAQCNGACNGSATVGVTSGGTAPFTFNWANGGTGAVNNALCAAFNVVTVTDANGCTGVDSVLVIDPNAVNITVLPVPTSCFGSCDGSAIALVIGGAFPYTYAWPSGVTDPIDTALCAGTYTLTVTDNNGCFNVETFTITEPPQIVTSITNVGPISCGSTCDGTATVNVISGGNPPFSFLWSNGGTNAANTALCAGVNTVTVTDLFGCTTVDTVTIIAPGALVLNVSSTNASCNGVCDGTATAAVSGGTTPYTYLWSNAAVVPNLSGLCAGTYSVTITDGSGCSLTDSTIVNEPAPIVLNDTVLQNVTCNGMCDGSALITVVSGGTAPFAFSWSNGNVGPSDTALCAGSYTITVTDGFGCTATIGVTITEPTLLLASANSTDASCNGVCDGTAIINASGGTTPYSFLWNNGSTNPALTALCGGTYIFTVTDGNGCTVVDSAIIVEPNAIITAMTTIGSASCGGACDGAASVAVVSGGTAPFTFQWSNGGNSNLDTALCAGLNFVTVTDGNGCTTVDSVNITGPNALTLTLSSTPTSCPGICDGTATASVTGGINPYTYLWNTGDTASNLNGLCAGTYTVTMTDFTGCFIIDSVDVVEPGALLLSFINVSNANCNGACDGQATVTVASGGTAPFTFNWSTGIVGGTDTALCAGTHTVTVTDANGCTGVDSIAIVNPGALIASATVNNNASCFGICDGSGTVAVNGGTAPFTFNWPSGNSTDTDNALCAGSFVVTVTDANGCSDTAGLTITEPGAIFTGFLNVSNATCNGVCDGVADVVVTSGGTGPFTFSWNNGSIGTNNNSLCAGNNFVTVTDANGCSTVDSVLIIEPPVLLSNVGGTNMSCGNICDAVAGAAPTGGTAPYTYQWNTGQSTDSINSLCAGGYDVTVTDANGCTAIGSHTVSSPTPIVANPGTVSATCGVCDGVAFVTPTGGNSPYTYAWNTGGSTTDSLTSLCAGLYTVTITDASGCTISETIPVSNFVPNVVVIDSILDVTCFGGNDGTAGVTVMTGLTPPFAYLWNDPGAQITPTAVGLTAGTYIVQISDASNCIVFRTLIVGEPDSLQVLVTSTNPSCNGDSDGSAVATVLGGTMPYTYTWTNFAVGPSVSNLSAGLIGVLVQDSNGCIAGDSVTLIDPPVITASASILSAISCPGSCDGELTVTALGGTPPYVQYEWQDAGGSIISTLQTASGLCAGTYFVTATDTVGCSANDSITIIDPAAMTTTTSVSNSISCNGFCDGEVTVTVAGGTPGYTFMWSNGDVTNIADSLCAGQYFVTVTDTNGCTTVDSIQLTEPTAIALTNVNVTSSNCGVCDGEISVTPAGGTGPFTFNWGNGQTTATATNLCAGVYDLTVTDSVGCAFVFPIPLSDTGGAALAVTSTDAGCNGACDGTAQVVATGGAPLYTYNWSNGDTTDIATGLCAGTYSITVTDSAGCISADTTTVNEPPPFTLTFATTPLACNGACIATAAVSTTGGSAPYTFLWSTGATTSTIGGLCAGVFTVTVTEATGCTSVDSVEIILPSVFAVTIAGTNVSCFGNDDGTATITATGGVAPYTYTWSTGDTTAALTGLGAGTFSVIVEDAGGCSDTLSVTVVEPTEITATSAVQSPSCGGNNGFATINPIGGVPFTAGSPYQYVWDDPLSQTNQTAANLSAAIYNVTVTDSIGCFEVFQVIVNDSGSGAITVDAVTPISCPGVCDGAIDISVAAGSPAFTYNWAGPSGFVDSSEDVDSLCAGTYSVTVTGSAGCQSFEIINLPDPTPLVFASFDVVNPSCGGDTNGQVTAHVTGGNQPLTFTWSGSTTTDSVAAGLAAGLLNVTVTDANGCSQVDSVTLTEPLPIVVSIDAITDATCTNSNDGAVQISVAGGSTPYTYVWTNLDNSSSAGSTQDLSNVLPANYQLVLTDSAGCSTTQNFTVNATVTVSATAPADTTLCAATSNLILVGSATTSAPGTVQWLDTSGAVVSTSDTLSIAPGTGTTQYVYLVSVGLCTDADTVVVTQASSVVADAGSNVSIVAGGAATLGGSPTGPVSSSFSWTPSASLDNASSPNPSATPDSTTTYVVTVTSPEGCSDVDTVKVTVLDALEIVNAFTPNGDGVNDLWIISILADYPNAKVEVFNRWGQSLFQSDGYTIPWDGTFEGNDLPIGTYYFAIDLGDPTTDPIIGTITIVR